MTRSPLFRGASIALLVFVGLILLSASRFGPAFESLIYTSYSYVMPILFAAMILGGIYFGARHLLTA